MEVHKSKCFTNGNKTEFTISLEVNDAFIALNKKMKHPDNEAWTSCHLELDKDGKYDIQFGYGIPPLSESMLKNAGEIK